MKMHPVESSMISAVGYDTQSKEMEVVFNSGAVWRYEDVPKDVFNGLLESGSKGSYMLPKVLGCYSE